MAFYILLLFDVGMGVVESLVDTLPGDKVQLDWLILSHWHPDHVLDLNRLCETWKRTLERRGEEWRPIPVWCRSGTAIWLKQNHDYECQFLNVHPSNEYNSSGRVLGPIPVGIPKLTITPITVSHCTADFSPSGGKLPCCASFVIEREGGKKAVLLWDIDNTNNWISGQGEAVELLSKADYLFIDCNTWKTEVDSKRKPTGHISFSTLKGYVKALQPKKTLLVHLSGHEDGKGNPGWGWDDKTWQNKAQEVWRKERLPGEVCVPQIGQKFKMK